MTELSIFVPLSKVNEEQRLVYGIAAEEVVDNSGEVFDYETSKPYFERWSENAFDTSGGKSKGNLRAMHGKVAAGKLTDISFNDDDRRVEVCAKVVDDNEWRKVQEGVYTGFSIGGRYAKRWTEKSDGRDAKRYTADPVEVSLVDKPCIKTALFQVIKADGSVETHELRKEDWDESAHPRDDHGRFAGGGGGDVPAAATAHGWDKQAWEAEFKDYSGRGVDPAKAAHARRGMAQSFPNVADLHNAIADHWDAIASGSVKKSEENTMFVPTNDALEVRSRELAKADGKDEAAWLEYIDAAREDLVKAADASEASAHNKDTKAPKADETGDADDQKTDDTAAADAASDSKKKVAEKADEVDPRDAIFQRWMTPGGQAFEKKDDAVAAVIAERAEDSDLVKSARAAQAMLDAVTLSEADQATIDSLTKFDLFFRGEGAPELAKGMYEVSNFANAMSSLLGVYRAAANETAREKDGSGVPAQIMDGLRTMATAFLAMAQEEVGEMLTGAAATGEDGCVPYFEYAASTLGLEKAALDEMTKRDVPVAPVVADDTMEKMAKLEGDLGNITTELAKRDAELAAIKPELEQLSKRVEEFSKMARPLPPRTHVVDKDGDNGGPVEKASAIQELEKLGPNALADMAIRMAQRNGQSYIGRTNG